MKYRTLAHLCMCQLSCRIAVVALLTVMAMAAGRLVLTVDAHATTTPR